jgi:carboxymethylenebutenolidase
LTGVWNSYLTDEHGGLLAEVISIRAGDDLIHAYVARPGGAGPRPGVVLVHHMPGWDEMYREIARRLADHGYTVISPDLYCRFGHGTPDDVAAAARGSGGVSDDEVVTICAAARAWLRSLPTSNGRVAIMGSCSGGRHAVLAASRAGGFDAVVDLWGGGVVTAPEDATPQRPVAPIEYTADLNAPLLGLFGDLDSSPSPADVDQHEAELKRLGKPYEFHRYPDAGHGFFYYHRTAYRPEAAMDGWAKVFAFFRTHLAGGGA